MLSIRFLQASESSFSCLPTLAVFLAVKLAWSVAFFSKMTPKWGEQVDDANIGRIIKSFLTFRFPSVASC